MNQIPLLDSQVIRAALLALVGLIGLILSFFGVTEDVFSANATRLVDAALLVITTGSVLWAAYARATKPTPPITDGAAIKTEEMAKSNQGGFVRPAMLGVLLFAAAVAGCAGLSGAYKAAAASAEPAAETAYVMAEQYAATLAEAATIAQNPATPAQAKQAIKSAELAATPVVLSLHGLRDSYLAVKSADNAAALQRAVNDAVMKVAALLRVIKSARGAP